MAKQVDGTAHRPGMLPGQQKPDWLALAPPEKFNKALDDLTAEAKAYMKNKNNGLRYQAPTNVRHLTVAFNLKSEKDFDRAHALIASKKLNWTDARISSKVQYVRPVHNPETVVAIAPVAWDDVMLTHYELAQLFPSIKATWVPKNTNDPDGQRVYSPHITLGYFS